VCLENWIRGHVLDSAHLCVELETCKFPSQTDVSDFLVFKILLSNSLKLMSEIIF